MKDTSTLIGECFIVKAETGCRRYGGWEAHSAELLTMGDIFCEELEDLVHFSVHDLPTRGYVVMEEIRRQGKLCDVTLKVKMTRRSDSC